MLIESNKPTNLFYEFRMLITNYYISYFIDKLFKGAHAPATLDHYRPGTGLLGYHIRTEIKF